MNQLGQVGVADERLVYVGAHQLDLLVVRPIDLLQKSNENQDSTTNSDNGYLLIESISCLLIELVTVEPKT